MNLRKRNDDLGMAPPFKAWGSGFSLSGFAGLIPVQSMDVFL